MSNRRRQKKSSASCGDLGELLSPKLFKALSDPRRAALLVRLAEAGEPCTVGGIAEGSGVDLSVVSRHLAILREVGVIECEKRGKEVWCVVQTRAIAGLLRSLADALETCCPDGCGVKTAQDRGASQRNRSRTQHSE